MYADRLIIHNNDNDHLLVLSNDNRLLRMYVDRWIIYKNNDHRLVPLRVAAQ